MAIPTIELILDKKKKAKVRFIDQTKLPEKYIRVTTDNINVLWDAIKKLKVRGAPAIGVAGAFGVVLRVQQSKAKSFTAFEKELEKAIHYLKSSRPTAVNLFWALDRMKKIALENKSDDISNLKHILLHEAIKIFNEDRHICRKMADVGANLIKPKDRILTHCNAGALATADFGTALGVIIKAHHDGKKIKVYVDETRPLLQGARLTAWELLKEGLDATLICDNMAASLMAKGEIDKIFVGADRIARNGDTANKVGTYSLAVLAHYHKIPFYIVAPISTFDLSLESGEKIPIEERSHKEVTEIQGIRLAPKNIKVYNPAFDVTPAKLIRAIVTEEGIFENPLEKSLEKLL